MSEQAPVTSQVHCQLPAPLATHATSGGPKNCPNEEHCCIQPTVVDTVPSLGAKRTAKENKVPGITPPTPENKTTATNLAAGDSPTLKKSGHVEKAKKAPSAITPKPTVSKR
jgi:hypothetical protein